MAEAHSRLVCLIESVDLPPQGTRHPGPHGRHDRDLRLLGREEGPVQKDLAQDRPLPLEPLQNGILGLLPESALPHRLEGH